MTKAPTWLAIAAALALPPALAFRSTGIERRIEVERDRTDALSRELVRLRATLGGLEEARRMGQEARVSMAGVREEFSRLEARLTEEGGRIEAIETGTATASEGGRQALEAVRRLGADLDGALRRFEGMGAGVASLSQALDAEAKERRGALATLSARVTRDTAAMESEMIGPTVQLSGEETVGSGVIVLARPAAGGTEAFVLTAYHVVRNIQSEGGNPAALRLILYGGGGHREVTGSLLAHEEGIDIALVRFVADGAPPIAARVAPRERLARLPVFTPVTTVGCPLGNDPIPTSGEIASTNSIVGPETYWMINAPAYFGNSGGGVFLSDSRELIGLYSKIYTHGRGRPTVISHMGLVTPIDRILGFLEKSGYGFLLPAGAAPQAASAPPSNS